MYAGMRPRAAGNSLHVLSPHPVVGQFVHLVGLSGGKSPAGVTKQRQDYFDDSSRQLGVAKAATGRSARGGDRVSRLGGPLQERDLAERAVIEANEAADREREIRKLLAGGQALTRRQAEEILDREARKTPSDRKEERRFQRAEARRKQTENEMGMRKKPAKHGSSKSRKKTEKKGTWICGECHLEGCEHRPKSAVGRPAELDRSLEAHLRLSPMTKKTILDCGLGMSDVAEDFAIAWRDGITLHAAADIFKARRKKAA
jgi:hypothetical protein